MLQEQVVATPVQCDLFTVRLSGGVTSLGCSRGSASETVLDFVLSL